MSRFFAVALALGMLVSSGLVHGFWTYRWRVPRELTEAPSRLEKIPLTIGAWTGKPLQLDSEQMRRAGITGYVMRRYENQRTGAALSVLLVCGRWGQVAVHPPDVCYQGAGFEVVGTKERFVVPGPDGTLAETWTARFRKQEAVVPSYLRILWCWSAGEAWKAPDNPRLTFAGSPVLFKLYVIRETAVPDERTADDPAVEFMQQFVPQLAPLLVDPT